MRTVLLAIVLAAACGGGASKSSTMAKIGGPTCGTVADAMVGMMGEGKESTKAFVDKKEELATIIRTRCDEDRWSADAKQCLSTMQTSDDAERCASLLTEAQQANLVRDQDAKFGPPAPEPPPPPAVAPEPEPAAVQPTTTAPPAEAPPPPKAKPAADPKKKARKKSAPRGTPMPDGVTGDPCDGGE